MSNKNVANHLHRYKRKNIGVDGKIFLVYVCTKPACSHYIRVDLAEGRLCECNICHETMIINKTVLTRSNKGGSQVKPHCSDCTKKKKVTHVEDVETITKFLDGIKTSV